MRSMLLIMSATIIAIALTGCGGESSADVDARLANEEAVDGSKFILAEEPDEAVGVIAARESAEDGAPLVLVGRIGGSANPWIDGRAAFTLLDASMSVVAEGADTGDDQLCMGDCCAAERINCTVLVKIVDEQGKLVSVDSRKLLGLQESDMVVVQGTAKKDESGNFTMLVRGVHIRN